MPDTLHLDPAAHEIMCGQATHYPCCQRWRQSESFHDGRSRLLSRVLFLALATIVGGVADGFGQEEPVPQQDFERSELLEALDALRSDVIGICESYVLVHDELSSLVPQLLPLEVKVQRLRQAVASGERAITEKQRLISTVQRNLQTYRGGPRSRSQVDWTNASALNAIQKMSSEIAAMQAALQPARMELGGEEQSLARLMTLQAEAQAKADAIYVRLNEILQPPWKCAAEKSAWMKQVHVDHSQIPEFGLVLAWLLFFEGKNREVTEVLDSVDRAVGLPLNRSKVDLQWELVYLGLLTGEGGGATSRLVRFTKGWPRYHRIPHLQALVAVSGQRLTTAKTKYQTALGRRDAERDVALNSDAAWFFAAAPREGLRDPGVAQRCIDRVEACSEGGTWKTWRARAAVLADEERWGEAMECLETARTMCPKAERSDVDRQYKAYVSKEVFNGFSEDGTADE